MNFELGEQIGKGSTGTVYYAKEIGLDRDLAVKYIHPALVTDEEAINRLLKEATLCAKLNHPNIVRVHDAGRDDDGRPYIVMEYLEGESLQSRLSRGKLSDRVTIEIAKQVLTGLAVAHAQGAIHRDLKPANIFLTSAGVAKILDFGIAKSLGTTQTAGLGLQVGTPEYMSPEVAEGKKVDNRSDLYSLGIMLYEMVTGTVPFTAETPMGVLYKHVHESVPQLPQEVTLTLRTTIVCLLRKSPKQRQQSAKQALDMLEGATASKVKPPTPAPRVGTIAPTATQAGPLRQGTEVQTPDGLVKTARPVSRVSKVVLAAACVIAIAAAVIVGNGVAPTVADFIVARMTVNLSLRVTPGQKFHVIRQQVVTLGTHQIQAIDEGEYDVKSVRKEPTAVLWSTTRDRSVIMVDKWKKPLSYARAASSNWPNKPGSKDGGWALSPLTLDTKPLHRGDGGKTKSGLRWTLDSTENVAGHRVANIGFSNLPTGNILLDSNYIDATTNRMKAVKKDPSWSFPTTGWKTTRIEDRIDMSTGIPTSIEFEQSRPGGFSFKAVITMTPLSK
jgi:hypothetical protein